MLRSFRFLFLLFPPSSASGSGTCIFSTRISSNNSRASNKIENLCSFEIEKFTWQSVFNVLLTRAELWLYVEASLIEIVRREGENEASAVLS